MDSDKKANNNQKRNSFQDIGESDDDYEKPKTLEKSQIEKFRSVNELDKQPENKKARNRNIPRRGRPKISKHKRHITMTLNEEDIDNLEVMKSKWHFASRSELLSKCIQDEYKKI